MFEYVNIASKVYLEDFVKKTKMHNAIIDLMRGDEKSSHIVERRKKVKERKNKLVEVLKVGSLA
jgi:hypothetical protein